MQAIDPSFFDPWNLGSQNGVGMPLVSSAPKRHNTSKSSRRLTANQTHGSKRGSGDMEKLQRRSDGYAETLSGSLAISPVRFSGRDNQYKWFDFRRTAVADITRIRWGIDDKIAIIDASNAKFMIGKNYAENVSDEQINEWNGKIDELMLDAPTPEPNIINSDNPPEIIEGQETPKPENTEQPAGAQEPAPATNTPPAAQTAPEGQDLANNGTPAPVATPPATEGGEQGAEGASENNTDGENGADNSDDADTDGDETDGDETEGDETETAEGEEKPKKRRRKKKDVTEGLL